jgi:hypothetical protein
MSRRLVTQGCRQVHRRDPSNNPKACEPCGQPSHLTRNTVASLHGVPRDGSPTSSVLRSTPPSCCPSRAAPFPSLRGTVAAPWVSFPQPQSATAAGLELFTGIPNRIH